MLEGTSDHHTGELRRSCVGFKHAISLGVDVPFRYLLLLHQLYTEGPDTCGGWGVGRNLPKAERLVSGRTEVLPSETV